MADPKELHSELQGFDADLEALPDRDDQGASQAPPPLTDDRKAELRRKYPALKAGR